MGTVPGSRGRGAQHRDAGALATGSPQSADREQPGREGEKGPASPGHPGLPFLYLLSLPVRTRFPIPPLRGPVVGLGVAAGCGEKPHLSMASLVSQTPRPFMWLSWGHFFFSVNSSYL